MWKLRWLRHPRETHSTRKRVDSFPAHTFAVAVLLIAAMALRMLDLGTQSLWTDEGMSWWVARLPIPQQMSLLREIAPNPLHYLALSAWMHLAGVSEFALRYLSVLGSVLAIGLAYRLGCELGGRRSGLVATALLALNPLHVYYAQEARAYAWLTALVLASALLLYRSRRGLTAGEVVALGGVQALVCLAHPYGAFVLLALNAVVGLAMLLTRALRRRLGGWLAANGVTLLIAGPWFWSARGAILGSAGSAIYFRGAAPWPQVAWDSLRVYATGLAASQTQIGALLLAAILAAGMVTVLLSRSRLPWAFVMAGCLAPVAGIILISVQRAHYAPRYVIAGAVFFCLLVGQFAAVLPPRRWATTSLYASTVVALLATMGWGCWRQVTSTVDDRPDFRSVSAYILARGDPASDAVVLVGGHVAPVMHYYLDSRGYTLFPMPAGLIQNVDQPLGYADLAILNRAVAEHRRVWLVLWQRELADPGGIVLDQLLRSGQRQEVRRDFDSINLLLFDIPPGLVFETDPQPQVSLERVWGDQLALRGYDLEPGLAVRPGQNIDVTLYWQPRTAISTNYLVSLQLIGSDGKLVSQADHMAHSDFYPTSLWRVNEILLDRYQLTVPPGALDGAYMLNIVVYDRAGARWLTAGSEVLQLAKIQVSATKR